MDGALVFTSDINPGSGHVDYDAWFPSMVVPTVNGAARVATHGDNLGSTSMDFEEADVDIRRYIDTSVGGRTGVANKNGYSTGIRQWWNGGIGVVGAFTGRTKRFVRRDLAKDTGPVGRSNYMGLLQSQVASMYTVPPSLEDIYRSIVGMGNGPSDV